MYCIGKHYEFDMFDMGKFCLAPQTLGKNSFSFLGKFVIFGLKPRLLYGDSLWIIGIVVIELWGFYYYRFIKFFYPVNSLSNVRVLPLLCVNFINSWILLYNSCIYNFNLAISFC